MQPSRWTTRDRGATDADRWPLPRLTSQLVKDAAENPQMPKRQAKKLAIALYKALVAAKLGLLTANCLLHRSCCIALSSVALCANALGPTPDLHSLSACRMVLLNRLCSSLFQMAVKEELDEVAPVGMEQRLRLKNMFPIVEAVSRPHTHMHIIRMCHLAAARWCDRCGVWCRRRKSFRPSTA